MSKPFDVAVKHLLDAYPADWLRLVGLDPAGPVASLDPDLSTVSAQNDKVLQLGGDRPSLLSLELQASYDATLAQRALKYNVLLASRYEMPVQSAIVLLRPEADGREMHGRLERHLPSGRRYLEFHFDVVRIWQLPPSAFLDGGLGTLPLAPLASVEKSAVPSIVAQMKKRLDRADRSVSSTLWTATYLLMGLKYDEEFAQRLLQGVREMKESVTYQAILNEGKAEGRAEGLAIGEAEGRVQEARQMLLRLGTKRFGKPSDSIRNALEHIAEIERLEQLSDRLLEVSSWDELCSRN